jgi:hypothetical protein
MIELMEIIVDAFPQAVGVAVMKIKSFGLMVAAIETRIWVVGTKVSVWIASLTLAMTRVGEGVTFLPIDTFRRNVVLTNVFNSATNVFGSKIKN